MSQPTNPSLSSALPQIVAELRASREGQGEHVHGTPLPSRVALSGIVDGLRAALFPMHFGLSELSEEGVDYFVGHTLDTTLSALQEQLRRGLSYSGDLRGEALTRQSIELTREFSLQLPKIRGLIERDIRASYEGDPAAKSVDEVIFCYPGATAITHHRLAHALYQLGAHLIARIIAEIAHSSTGIDIHPGAQIGGSFFVDHGTGVVIGETCVIGERVRLYQGVTLGAKSFPKDTHGAAIKGIPRHPIIEDDVVIYAGATILGRITIGRGSSIGGNVWLTRSVPPNSRITQAQAQSEAFDGGAGI